MTVWIDEQLERQARFGLGVTRTLFDERSEFQAVAIHDTVTFGRALMLDDVWNTSVVDERFYHEMIVHPAMTTSARIERVLVIGGGDGGTAREVLRYPQVRQVVMCEIDRMVVDACAEHLPELGAWDDPRLELIIGDGAAYVARLDIGRFDVIIVDSTDPIGPAVGLFNAAFYGRCRQLLTGGGVLAVHSETPMYYREAFVAIVRMLRQVFGAAHPYFGPVPLYACGDFSWTLAPVDPAAFDPRAIDPERATIAARTCEVYNSDVHRGALAIPTYLQRALDPPA